MITDAQNRPTTVAQTIQSAASTVVSTDSIDLLTANRNVGRGYPLRMIVVVTVSLAGGTSVMVEMITSANANLSSPTVIGTGLVVAEANAVAGTRLFDKPIPGTAQRYLGLQFTTVGTHTAGAVQGDVVAESDNQPYVTMNTGL